ncbi:helix-turn-helix DNA binding domain protein [Gordonia phage Budski]|nr:helix-turn-helix DNA binding domain protein [Gordonia phage Budski]
MATRPGRDNEGRHVIAAALRAEMARAGVSGRQLAERVGKNHQWVQHRMSGKVALTTDDVRPIAAALGLHPREFLAKLGVELQPIGGDDD